MLALEGIVTFSPSSQADLMIPTPAPTPVIIAVPLPMLPPDIAAPTRPVKAPAPAPQRPAQAKCGTGVHSHPLQKV